MNDFLTALVKVSFVALAIIGALVLALGMVLLFYPDTLFQILWWGSAGTLVIGGVILSAGALYGYAMARKAAS